MKMLQEWSKVCPTLFLRKECFIYGNPVVITLHCLHAGRITISPRQVAQLVNLAPAVFWQHGFFGPGAWQTAGNAIFALSLIYLLAALVGVYVNFARKGKD